MRLGGFLMALALVACACDAEPVEEDPSQPDGFIGELPLTTLEDQDPDPHVLEVTLRASLTTVQLDADTSVTAWTYGGTLPGPLLRLTAGDRLIVHFENDLPEATTIHWHGVRVPVEMDGSPHYQEPIEPGDSFTYDFVVPDPGLFWYHPHWHDAAQLGFGLYGALLVDPVEPEPDLGDEVVLVLSDIAVDEDGALIPEDTGGDLATLFGREGDIVLVNGKRRPKMLARSGKQQRWRIVNAAKSRYFLLGLTGHSFTRIGGHTGRLETPEAAEQLLLLPGERADIVVTPHGAEGVTEQLLWIPYDRGYGSTEFRDPEPVMDVTLVGAALSDAPDPIGAGPRVEPLDVQSAEPVAISLTLNNTEDGKIKMGINGVPFEDADPIPATVGQTQVWTIDNEMSWDHPFHLHGFFFQPLDASGSPREHLEWLDTINVPRDATTKIAVRYDNRPGMWMFHCHILDHADVGMMGMIDLQR